jgi:L-2-hydroxycarboxylate dehydrogenase (NAD+)
MATSAVTSFGVLSAKAKGEALPPNVAHDAQGNWTADAATVLEEGGAIATFGGHKGVGLALCMELLAGALSGAAVLGQVRPSKREAKNWGHTVIAIQPNMMVDAFESKAASIIATVKNLGEGLCVGRTKTTTRVLQYMKTGTPKTL